MRSVPRLDQVRERLDIIPGMVPECPDSIRKKGRSNGLALHG
jgi:hypothetical protein